MRALDASANHGLELLECLSHDLHERLSVRLVDPPFERDSEDGDAHCRKNVRAVRPRPLGDHGRGEWLRWEPTHPGLIEDLEQGHYFQSP